MNPTTTRTVSFGPYTFDLRSGELRKFGTKLKMGEQPFQILLILLEGPGEMVTREQLREKLRDDFCGTGQHQGKDHGGSQRK